MYTHAHHLDVRPSPALERGLLKVTNQWPWNKCDAFLSWVFTSKLGKSQTRMKVKLPLTSLFNLIVLQRPTASVFMCGHCELSKCKTEIRVKK